MQLSKRGELFLLIMMAVVWCLCAITSLSLKTATGDEIMYMVSSHYLAHGSEWQTPINTWHPPLVLYVQGVVARMSFNDMSRRLLISRLFMLPFGLILGYIIWLWTKQLFNRRAAFFAAAFFCLSPNILAHARLVTLDVPMVTMSVITLYFFWRFARDNSMRAAACGIMFLAAAVLTKFTAIFLVPLACLLIFWRAVIAGGLFPEQSLMRRIIYGLLGSIIVSSLVLVLVNAGYFFTGTFSDWSHHRFMSEAFGRLAVNPLTRRLLFFLPEPFVRGLDYQKYISEFGFPTFLAGEYSLTGWWYYFPVVWLIKTPLPLIIMTAASVVLFFRRSDRQRHMYVILIPLIFFVIYFSFINHLNIGLRHILVIYPFLHIFAGATADTIISYRSRFAKILLSGLVCWYAITCGAIYPHYLAYANELIGGPKQGYRYLHDCDLAWGQDNDLIRQYVYAAQEPFTINPANPVLGRSVISVMNMQLYPFLGRDRPEWLWQFTPIDWVGYSWLVFDLSVDDYEKVFTTHPEMPDSYYAFAYVLMLQGQYDRARNIIADGRARFEQYGRFAYLEGLLFIREELFSKAIRSLEQALQSDKYFLPAYEVLFLLYDRNDDQAHADEVYHAWMQARTWKGYLVPPAADEVFYRDNLIDDMTDSTSANNLGVLLWEQGRYDEALKWFEQALMYNPLYSDALLNKSRVLEALGRDEAACRVHEEYLRLWHSSDVFQQPRFTCRGEQVMLHTSLVISQYQTDHAGTYEGIYQYVLAIKRDADGHPFTVDQLHELAYRYGQLKDPMMTARCLRLITEYDHARDAHVDERLAAIYGRYAIKAK